MYSIFKLHCISIDGDCDDMRMIVQRTAGVELFIDSKLHSRTEAGLLLFLGCKTGDNQASCGWLADKLINLRLFEDSQGKMNLSAIDISAEIMVVSQFTLYADSRKGRRPSFAAAMEPVQAEELYNHFVELVAASGLTTQTGIFGATMDVKFVNRGPVTLIVDHDTD